MTKEAKVRTPCASGDKCQESTFRQPKAVLTYVIVPFIGRKNGILTARQQCCYDGHGWHRACIEQLFAHLWHWGLVRNIWRHSPMSCTLQQLHAVLGRVWDHVQIISDNINKGACAGQTSPPC